MPNAKYYCTSQIYFANNFGLYSNGQQRNQYDHLHYGRIWNVLLSKDSTYQLDRAKNKPWNMWQMGNAGSSHALELSLH